MPFDIKRIADIEPGEDELYDYQEELLKLFADSPEGQARAKEDEGMIFWAKALIEYGFSYSDNPLHEMDKGDLEELLTEVFPHKISLAKPEDADDALPAIIAFWEYLKREYQLKNADDVLAYLRSVKPQEFRTWMNDPSNFGTAKSFLSMAKSEGFDLTKEEDNNAFMKHYNAKLLSSDFSGIPLPDGDVLSLLEGGDFGPAGKTKKERDRAKHLRKIARASRKKNRKRK